MSPTRAGHSTTSPRCVTAQQVLPRPGGGSSSASAGADLNPRCRPGSVSNQLNDHGAIQTATRPTPAVLLDAQSSGASAGPVSETKGPAIEQRRLACPERAQSGHEVRSLTVVAATPLVACKESGLAAARGVFQAAHAGPRGVSIGRRTDQSRSGHDVPGAPVQVLRRPLPRRGCSERLGCSQRFAGCRNARSEEAARILVW